MPLAIKHQEIDVVQEVVLLSDAKSCASIGCDIVVVANGWFVSILVMHSLINAWLQILLSL